MQAESRGSWLQLLSSFIIALVSGCLFAFFAFLLCFSALGLGFAAFHGSELALFLVGGVPAFLGGIASGGAMESVLRKRRWRFLYLVASSPGVPVWGLTVFLAAGGGVSDTILFLGVAASLCAFAGAALGYTLVHRRARYNCRRSQP